MMLLPDRKVSALRVALLATVMGAGVMLASAAQAFTFEGQTTANGGSGSNLDTPAASRLSPGTSDGQTTIKQGNTTFQFGRQRSLTDDSYYPSQLFGPSGRPSDGR